MWRTQLLSPFPKYVGLAVEVAEPNSWYRLKTIYGIGSSTIKRRSKEVREDISLIVRAFTWKKRWSCLYLQKSIQYVNHSVVPSKSCKPTAYHSSVSYVFSYLFGLQLPPGMKNKRKDSVLVFFNPDLEQHTVEIVQWVNIATLVISVCFWQDHRVQVTWGGGKGVSVDGVHCLPPPPPPVLYHQLPLHCSKHNNVFSHNTMLWHTYILIFMSYRFFFFWPVSLQRTDTGNYLLQYEAYEEF